MGAAIEPLYMEAGATWRYVLAWEDAEGNRIALAGYKGRMQIRRSVFAATVEAELNTEADDGTMTFDTDDDGDVIVLRLGADKTLTLPATVSGAPLVYDLELTDRTDATEVVRLIKGSVEVDPNVTRDTGDPVPQ